MARRQVATLRSFGLSLAADEIVTHYPDYSEAGDEQTDGYAACG